MAKTPDNTVENRNGMLSRPIPEAMNELSRLLNSRRTTVTQLHPLIAELEQDYRSVREHFGIAPQHEADAANTMNGIYRLLTDHRLARFGVTSALVEEIEAATPRVPHVGHDQI